MGWNPTWTSRQGLGPGWSCDCFPMPPTPTEFIYFCFPHPLNPLPTYPLPPSFTSPSYFLLPFSHSQFFLIFLYSFSLHFTIFSCSCFLPLSICIVFSSFFVFSFLVFSFFDSFCVCSLCVCEGEELYSNKNLLGHIVFLLLVNHRGRKVQQ